MFIDLGFIICCINLFKQTQIKILGRELENWLSEILLLPVLLKARYYYQQNVLFICLKKYGADMNIKQILLGLRKSPKDVELLLAAFDFYCDSENYSKAGEFARKAYLLDRDNPWVMMKCALIYNLLSEKKKCIWILKKIQTLSLKDIAICPQIGTMRKAVGFKNDMLFWMAQEYWNLSDYSTAAKLASEVIRKKVRLKHYSNHTIREVRSFIEEAELSRDIEREEKKGNWVSVGKLCNHLLRKFPDNPWTWNHLILSYYERYEYRKSLEISSKALEKFPDDGYILFNHAGALQMLERYDEAAEIFGPLARSSEKRLIAKYQASDLTEARQLKNDACYRLGRCYAGLGKNKLAAKWLNQYIEGRKAGMGGIYNLNTVKKVLRELSAD